jgi:precorrin-3B C17-methyltransferase
LEYKSGDTICGIVKNIAREGESMEILTLKELEHTEVDMFSTVFIGNKDTRIIRGHMVTPRGYRV